MGSNHNGFYGRVTIDREKAGFSLGLVDRLMKSTHFLLVRTDY